MGTRRNRGLGVGVAKGSAGQGGVGGTKSGGRGGDLHTVARRHERGVCGDCQAAPKTVEERENGISDEAGADPPAERDATRGGSTDSDD